MDVIALIGRILFAGIFLSSAYGHFTSIDAATGYAQSKKLPQPRLAVQVSGGWIALAAVMLVLGAWPDLGALMLVPFLLLTAFLFHGFWNETDAQAKMQEQTQFFKDLALCGGALALWGFYGQEDGPGLILLGPLFSF